MQRDIWRRTVNNWSCKSWYYKDNQRPVQAKEYVRLLCLGETHLDETRQSAGQHFINCPRFLITNKKEMEMSNIVDGLTKLISDITKLETEHESLKDNFASEVKKAHKKFNTETHILLERKFLMDIGMAVEQLSTDASYATDEVEQLESYASGVRGYCEDVTSSADCIESDIRQVLQSEDE